MKKSLLVILILATGALAAGFFWWRGGQTHAHEPALVLQGNVDIRQVSLAFDGNGRVTDMLAEEGATVKAGEVLARLDVQTLRLQVGQARAQAETQQQNLLRLRNGSRPEDVAQARSRLQAARTDATRSAEDLQRLVGVERVTQGRGVSAQDLDRAEAAVQVAQAKVQELEQALALITRGARKEDVAAAQAQASAAQAQIALLQHQIELGELRAPADGIIRARLLEPGDMATPQRSVYALALAGPKWIRVYAAEAALSRIRPGMAAQVTTDSQPQPLLSGTVAFISSVAEFTPKTVQTEELRSSLVYEVRVRIDDPGNVLRMGQPATVRLATAPQ